MSSQKGQKQTNDDGDIGDGMISAAPIQPPTRQIPEIWGDVPPRNPYFTGREALLNELHDAMGVSREAAVLPQALYGLGGVGKSQVAIEYVYRYSREYDVVWWIPAEENTQILSSLTRLAQALGLGVSPEANNAVPAVQDALNTGKIEYARWLLVFDNAESINEVRRFFPTGGAGKVLVTSRSPEWARVARAIEVDVFARDESKALLRNHAPELSDDDTIRLGTALGDLPLALQQAGAWLAATGMSVDEYLSLLEAKRLELLDDASPPWSTSVAAAWNVSLDRLDRTNPAALQLLQICSFFSSEPIPREFFASGSIPAITEPLDETLRDPIKLGRAIRDIQRYALAKFDHRTNALQVHRLMQTVLAGRVDESRRQLMRAGAHSVLASSNPHDPARQSRWGRYEALLPHVRASAAVTSTDPEVMRLVFDSVTFLFHWGDRWGSLTMAEEAYGNWRARLGEAHPETLRLAKFVGYLHAQVGKFQSAVELFRNTFKLYVEHVGEEDEHALDAMLLVAYSHRITGDFQRAKELDEKAHRICQRLFGEDDPVTLRAAHNLGVSLSLNGEFQRSIDLNEKTQRARTEVLGDNDSETHRTLNNLIIGRRESGEFIEARKQQEDACARALAAFTYPDNPAVLCARRNLVVARRKAGDHLGALTLSAETAELYRRRYGPDDPETMATTLNLAIDRRHSGDLAEARRLGEDTLARYCSTLGADHPHTVSASASVAIVQRLLGDTHAAHRANERALEALTSRLGADHPNTLACAANFASDLFAAGDTQAAFQLDTDTLARSKRVLGAEHPSTLAVSANLVLDLRALARDREADVLHADTVARFRRTLGDQHPATLNALKSLRADCDVDPMPL
jgi:tetratricopeptide (TPR) repeat protein